MKKPFIAANNSKSMDSFFFLLVIYLFIDFLSQANSKLVLVFHYVQ